MTKELLIFNNKAKTVIITTEGSNYNLLNNFKLDKSNNARAKRVLQNYIEANSRNIILIIIKARVNAKHLRA